MTRDIPNKDLLIKIPPPKKGLQSKKGTEIPQREKRRPDSTPFISLPLFCDSTALTSAQSTPPSLPALTFSYGPN